MHSKIKINIEPPQNSSIDWEWYLFAFAWKAKSFVIVFLLLLFCTTFSELQVIWSNKKYFMDHKTANTVDLFAAIKEHFCGLFFFWISRSKREFPRV